MKTSEQIDQIVTALAAAQAEMPDAIFDSSNPHFRSKYASYGAVRKAVQALHKHDIAIIHAKEFLPDGSYILETRLAHKTGQWIASEWPISIGSPQSMGSSETYGKRYNLSGLTSVAADEDDDANEAQVGGVAAETLDRVPTLSKAKSRPVYEELVKEVRAIDNAETLYKWGFDNKPRINSMHKDFQNFFLEDYKAHKTAIAEGVTEDGKSIGEQINDSIPEPEAPASSSGT